MVVAAFNGNGSLDDGFATHGVAIESFSPPGSNDLLNTLAIQADGKIVAAGTTSPASAPEARLAVIRLDTNGSLDTTFGDGGLVATDFDSSQTANQMAWAVKVESDGKIVAAGMGGGTFDVARYTSSFTSLVSTKLTITGTPKADTIDLQYNAASAQYIVTLDGISQTYSSSKIGSIEIDALAGNDSVTIGPGIFGVLVNGGPGNDTIIGGDGNDTLFGGAGDDLIQGMAGNDSIDGNAGNNTLRGNTGDDTIVTGAGDSQLFGAAGNDSLNSANGFADTLDGGAGTNHGVWDAGLDSITNVGP
jgi:uncharacterized delta-60 repeat protein